MRSLILVILSAVLLGGLFMFVWTLQPASSRAMREPSQITPAKLKAQDGYGPIKPGERIWLKQFDRSDQLASRFTGDEFLPQHDGTFRITNPEADFFLANHQRLEIRGVVGNVVMKEVPNLGPSGLTGATSMSPPNRGRLNHVTVRLVDELTNEAMLTMTTNNVVFDNETYRISTEGYTDEHGNAIADDMVPVFVTGKIKMQGKGLTVRWNDRDGRLELLEIAHGDVLEITDPANLSFGGGGAKANGKSPVPQASLKDPPLPERLAAAAKAAVGEVLTHHPAPVKPPQPATSQATRTTAPPIYRATFYDNVWINQPNAAAAVDQVKITNVDVMDVDFLMKQSSGGTTTQPAAAPASQPAAVAPATAPATQTVAAPATQAAATQPAAPKEPPIYVHWTGPLRIVPAPTPSPVPLGPGDSAVLLAGAPVYVHRVDPKDQSKDEITSATVLYATAGDRVILGRSDRCPQVVVDKIPADTAKERRRTHLVSEGSVEYARGAAGQNGWARLIGPGTANVPLEPDPKTPNPQLDAAWAKSARFDFTPDAPGRPPTVTFGRLEGKVEIRHPKLALDSQSLDLLFEPPAANAMPSDKAGPVNVRQIIATGVSKCQAIGAEGKPQNITADRLVLDTDKADGKLYARHMVATGHAHAWAEDDLKGDLIDVLLRPAKKKPADARAARKPDADSEPVELERMVCSGNVRAESKDGSVAIGDDLLVTTVDGKQHVVLTSHTEATVTDAKQSVVKGPEIQFDSADGKARVIGPGSLHAIQQASTTQPAQPMDVTWTGGATFDGDANRIDVDQNCRAVSTDKKGFVDVAVGDHMHIDLRAKPTTQPAPSSDLSLARSKAPGSAGGNSNLKMDPFKGKEVSAITIDKGATITSTLSDPQGGILQQFELRGPTIHVDEFAPDGTPARRITVPAAGQMLVRDHRPPAAKNESSRDNVGAGGARGATAFAWDKQLIYIEAEHRALMLGNVRIVHQEEEATAPRVTLDAERVTVWFEPEPKHAGKQSGGNEGSGMQVRYLSAEGPNVVVRREPDEIVARQVDYNPNGPNGPVIIATGTARNPVALNNGLSMSGTAERVEWDTNTWKMRTTNAKSDDLPPVPSAPPPPKAGKKQPATLPTYGNRTR